MRPNTRSLIFLTWSFPSSWPLFLCPCCLPYHARLFAQNQRLGWPSREHSSSSSSSEEEEEEEELDRSRQWSRTSSGSRGVGNGSGRSRRAGKRPGNGIAGGAASGALTATRRPSSRRASGGAGGGGGGSSGGGDVPASVAVEVGRSKYGFRDRNTIKRTDFFTYERVRSACG